MNFRDEKIQTVTSGLSVLFLVLLVLMLSSAVAAQEIQLVEQAVSLSQSKPQEKQSEHPLINNLIDYSTQIQSGVIVKEALQGISEVINDVQHYFKLSGFSTDISKKWSTPQIMAVVLSFLLIFIFLFRLLIRKKKAITETNTSKPIIDSIAFREQNPANIANETLTDNVLSDESDENSDSRCINEIKTAMNIVQHEKIDVFAENITANETDTDHFLIPDPKQKKTKRKGRSILEAAFEQDLLSNSTGFIEEQELLIEDSKPAETQVLNSVDEIRFVNEKTRNLKVDAFLDLTQAEKLTDEMLSHDFDKIMSNEKVDVFIREFEDVMSNLTNHTPVVINASNELENLLQFKLSIHFIKVLSEMMQATHLKQFSTTVIEFLDDVVNGNTRLTTDVTNRLLFVVQFYDRYIYSIKQSHSYK